MHTQHGDRVRIHYTARSLEGSVIESSLSREPLEFRAGDPEVIRGLSQGVVGMAVGERRTLTVPPEQAFGRHNTELIQLTPRSCLPEGVGVGDQLAAWLGEVTLDVWVQRLMEHEAVVDANHPLAGETLVIDVQRVG